jgi:hypothetical protein
MLSWNTTQEARERAKQNAQQINMLQHSSLREHDNRTAAEETHMNHCRHVPQQIDGLEWHIDSLQVRQQVQDVVVVFEVCFIARQKSRAHALHL